MLTLQGIRQIALQNGYDEIECNECSRVVSFRRGSTRINVYYTTGSVATCLNHPTKGKTQLFRRGILRTSDLADIFDNPRSHTGKGYYTWDSIEKKWKSDRTDQELLDSARRWIYVGSATGIVQTEREQRTITKICTEWDTLLWKPVNYSKTKSTRYGCELDYGAS